ncbi:hypothetical protein [Phenylobacterium sp.]|uniref:hypothetical protein n=1 Tax=Phenylobacterium sp. TaxID=1871053 RepID=UPI002F93048B
MRYEVKVRDGAGGLVCGATLNCPDDAMAQRRFGELPLPTGEAELRRGARLLARRAETVAPLPRAS